MNTYTTSLLSLVLSATLFSGCGDSDASQDDSKTATLSQTNTTILPQPHTLQVDDILQGTYTCNHGVTKLDLVIEKISDNTIDAIFDFDYPGGDTFSSGVGQYKVSGDYNEETHELELAAGEWIYNPNDFTSIGMKGTLEDNNYTGTIQGSQSRCSTFSLQKINP